MGMQLIKLRIEKGVCFVYVCVYGLSAVVYSPCLYT